MKDLFIKPIKEDAFAVYTVNDIPDYVATIVYSGSSYIELRYYLVLINGDTESHKFLTFPDCISFVRETIES